MCVSTSLAPHIILQDYGIQAVLRRDERALWEQTQQSISYVPVCYSDTTIDYQTAYWSSVSPDYVDVSIILLHNNIPCGIWPLSVKRQEESWVFGSSGDRLLPPLLISGLSGKTQKKIITACMNTAMKISADCKQNTLEILIPFTENFSLCEWHQRTVIGGAQTAIRHDLYTDLTPDMAAIKNTYRKSYKSLISSGMKLWDVAILKERDESIWTEYRMLHAQVAGRSTRTLETWDIHHQAIENKDAFLVYLRDHTQRMIGGGLFHFTKDEGQYAVGVYDRTLFDKPLGHVVQFLAMQELKARNVRWYRIGHYPMITDCPPPTDKEINISEFKKGFASHMLPCFQLSMLLTQP